jgi:hypothetical protein
MMSKNRKIAGEKRSVDEFIPLTPKQFFISSVLFKINLNKK